MGTKICKKCLIEKDFEEFAKANNVKDGRYSYCKKCKNAWKRTEYDVREGTNIRSIKARFNIGVREAAKRQLNWEIELINFSALLKLGCFYCQKDLISETGYCLDRKNNNEDYTDSNVVPCCGRCNQSRMDNFTHEEWVVAMKAVKDFKYGHITQPG